jgi:MFS family permease
MAALLLANLGIALVAMPYSRLMAGFVIDALDGGAGELGLLMSVTGVGSLAGSLVIASLPSRRRGMLWLASTLVLGVALLAFALSTSVWMAIPIVIVLGIGQSGRMSLGNVLVQSYVDDEYRGRVTSILQLERSGISFSAFGVGMLAALVGVQYAFAGLAIGVLVLGASLLLFVPRVRNLD